MNAFCQSLHEHLHVNLDIIRNRLVSIQQDAGAHENHLLAWKTIYDMNSDTRPGFELFAECTAETVRDAVKKIECFELNQDFLKKAVKIFQHWQNNKALYTFMCDRTIDANAVALMFPPLLERTLSGGLVLKSGKTQTVFEMLAQILENFAKKHDLYDFKKILSEILFSCPRLEDRIFIIQLISPLEDFQRINYNVLGANTEKLDSLKLKYFEPVDAKAFSKRIEAFQQETEKLLKK